MGTRGVHCKDGRQRAPKVVPLPMSLIMRRHLPATFDSVLDTEVCKGARSREGGERWQTEAGRSGWVGATERKGPLQVGLLLGGGYTSTSPHLPARTLNISMGCRGLDNGLPLQAESLEPLWRRGQWAAHPFQTRGRAELRSCSRMNRPSCPLRALLQRTRDWLRSTQRNSCDMVEGRGLASSAVPSLGPEVIAGRR